MRFTAEPTTAAELERTLNLADEIIRHKVLVVPEKKDEAAEAQGTFPHPGVSHTRRGADNFEVVS